MTIGKRLGRFIIAVAVMANARWASKDSGPMQAFDYLGGALGLCIVVDLSIPSMKPEKRDSEGRIFKGDY